MISRSLEEHRHEAFAALGHRLGKVVGRHVGMDEILFLVVDVLQLVFELQHVLHAVLQHVDGRQVAAVAPTLGNARPRGCDQLVQHDVVLLELLVERVVVALFADMHGADQVDLQTFAVVPFAVTILGYITHDGGLHGERIVVGVARQPQEAGSRLVLLRGLAFVGNCLGLLGLVGQGPQAEGYGQCAHRDRQKAATGHGDSSVRRQGASGVRHWWNYIPRGTDLQLGHRFQGPRCQGPRCRGGILTVIPAQAGI